jgi:hypothetical protein
VLIVKVVENVGLPDARLKLQDAAEGRPLVHERVTDCEVPVCKVAVIVFEPDEPRVTVIPLEVDNE